MRKIVALAVALSILLIGCSKPLVVDGKTYPPYGIFTEKRYKSAHICYEVSFGDVFWSIVLVETVVVPLYLVGWHLNQPVRPKRGPHDECTIDDAPSHRS